MNWEQAFPQQGIQWFSWAISKPTSINALFKRERSRLSSYISCGLDFESKCDCFASLPFPPRLTLVLIFLLEKFERGPFTFSTLFVPSGLDAGAFFSSADSAQYLVTVNNRHNNWLRARNLVENKVENVRLFHIHSSSHTFHLHCPCHCHYSYLSRHRVGVRGHALVCENGCGHEVSTVRLNPTPWYR